MRKKTNAILSSLFVFLIFFITLPAFADDHGNSCSSATRVNIGSSTTGRIENGGDYDYFRIQMRSTGTITVYSSGNNDTYGSLYNASCQQITRNDDSGSGYNFRISRSVSSGTYYVKVRLYNSRNTGSYRLHVDNSSPPDPPDGSDDHGNSTSTASRINLNSTVNGNIERAGDYDYFRIHVESQGSLKVYSSGNTDTYGYLKNTSGNTMYSNDDSGAGRNFQISKRVNSGTYYIAVRHYSSSRTGSYSLRAEFRSSPPPASDDHGNSCSSATRVNIGRTVNGNIESGGDYDFFRVSVSSNSKLRVYSSGSTDTYAYLKNANCNTIARNDDSGEGRNFKIEYTVSPGTYYVAVKHYNSNSTGRYVFHAETVTESNRFVSANITPGSQPIGRTFYFRAQTRLSASRVSVYFQDARLEFNLTSSNGVNWEYRKIIEGYGSNRRVEFRLKNSGGSIIHRITKTFTATHDNTFQAFLNAKNNNNKTSGSVYWIGNSSTGVWANSSYTYCARLVRMCFGKSARFSSAISMYNHFNRLNLIRTGSNPPLGAAVFYAAHRENGSYGHTGISDGERHSYSVVSKTNGVLRKSITGAFRARYLGYVTADDFVANH